MFLNNMRTKNIILWGTGLVSEEFLLEWRFYEKVWRRIAQRPFPPIQNVWDSDAGKHGTRFHEWEVVKPLEAIPVHGFCIIAIARRASIVSGLKQKGYREGVDFQPWRSFLASLRYDMTNYIGEILMDFIDKNLLEISRDQITNTLHSSNSMIDAGKIIYEKVNESVLDEYEKVVIGDLLLGYILKHWMSLGCEKSFLLDIKNSFSLTAILSGMSMVLDKEGDRIIPFFTSDVLSNKKRSIKTIGIYDLRFSNGGGQKVLSLLLPMYVSLGYRVILLTDERGEKEYPLPNGVVRIVLKHTHLGVMKLRLEEFRRYILEYDIDIMCFHYVKHDINLFYETLYLKLLGIPVLAEIHVMFMMMIRRRSYAAQLWASTFRWMDRIIVLSRYNALFWKNLGCKALYIPNPVENGRRLWNQPISFSKRNGKRILWIGRTTERGKHLLDVIDIMDEVSNVIPDVELRIVGDSEGLSHLHRLIAEKHLERNIIFCGYHTDVTSFYEESDVMLMTSEMEGFPMILVESKLHGVPTVMYELPYLELVRDARGVLPVPQRDIGAAARALCCVLSDDTMRHRLSIEAKRSIYPFISYDIAGAWKQVFDEISNPEEVGTPHPDQQMVQELLMQEIWKEEE